MASSSIDFLSKSAHRRIRKLLARSYLNEIRSAEALDVYLGVLRDDPDDAEVMIVLGNLYRLAGSPCTARRLYRKVLATDPLYTVAQQQDLWMETSSESFWEELSPLSEEAVQRLAARLRRDLVESQRDALRTAADMLENTFAEDRLDGQAGAPFDTMQQLMPALVAQNIRQARAAGHSELADALQSLQINLVRQADDRWPEDMRPEETALDIRPPMESG